MYTCTCTVNIIIIHPEFSSYMDSMARQGQWDGSKTDRRWQDWTETERILLYQSTQLNCHYKLWLISPQCRWSRVQG